MTWLLLLWLTETGPPIETRYGTSMECFTAAMAYGHSPMTEDKESYRWECVNTAPTQP